MNASRGGSKKSRASKAKYAIQLASNTSETASNEPEVIANISDGNSQFQDCNFK